MKKIWITLACLLSLHTVPKAYSQSFEAEQLILNWEKLQQLEGILDNMYRGYKILSKGYLTIKNVTEGNYKLHNLFLDGLMAINPSVRNYKRIPYIIDYQKLLLKEYKRAYDRFRKDPNFKLEEIEYLTNVYKHLFDASVRNLEQLLMIVTATQLRMSDEERLKAIDMIFYDMESKLSFLRSFNANTQLLAIQRARANGDINTTRQLYGLD